MQKAEERIESGYFEGLLSNILTSLNRKIEGKEVPPWQLEQIRTKTAREIHDLVVIVTSLYGLAAEGHGLLMTSRSDVRRITFGALHKEKFYAFEEGPVPSKTPSGRRITYHGAEMMAIPKKGRRVSTPAEADILAETGTFVKAEINTETLKIHSITLTRFDLPGNPTVVISPDFEQRIITIIIRKETPPIQSQ